MSQAPGDTLYTFRQDSKPVLERVRDNVTQMAAYRDGALVAPSSGTYTLWGPRTDIDDGDAIVDGEAVTVSGSVAQYTVAAASLPATVALGQGYMEVWSLVMPDGKTYTVRRSIVVGRFQLFPPLTEEDLVQGEYPDLTRNLGASGTSVLQGIMDGAWSMVIRHLESRGRWADILVDSSDLFDWYRHEVLRRCFSAMLMRQPNERWMELFAMHRDEARIAKEGLRITVDRDRDGRADTEGKEAGVQPIVPNIPPRRVLRRKKWG